MVWYGTEGYGTMRAKATYETVRAVCDRLWADGIEPTADLVLQETGGSRGTVLPLLRQWKAERDSAASEAAAKTEKASKGKAGRTTDDTMETAAPRYRRIGETVATLRALVDGLDTAAHDDLGEALGAERAHHAEALQSVAAAADERTKAAEADRDAKVKAADERAEKAEAEADRWAGEADRLEDERDAALADVERLTRERDGAIAKVDVLQGDLSALQDERDEWKDKAQARELEASNAKGDANLAWGEARSEKARADTLQAEVERLERLLAAATAPRPVIIEADDED